MQTTTIHYTNCPVCNSTSLKPVFNVKDYTVSGEFFPVLECSNCGLRFTQDVPSADSISPYYKSEDYISHTNTSKGIINRLYQAVRKRTMLSKRKMVEKATEFIDGVILEQFGQHTIQRTSVFQRITHSRRRLRPITQYPNFTVRSPRQISGIEHELMFAR